MKFIILSILLLLQSILIAQSKNPIDENIIDDVIKLTYDCQFEDALRIVENNLSKNNESLQWKYFKGMVFYRQWLFENLMSRNETDRKQSDKLLQNFYDEFRKVSECSEEILKKNPADTLALFYGGAAYGYIGIYHAGKDELFKAVSEGKKGIDFHEKLMRNCPKWTDVYLTAGMFNFYASNVPWYMKPIMWIFGKSGDEEKAYRYLKLVSHKGKLAKYEAMEMLLELSLQQKNDKLSKDIFEKLIVKFPYSRYYYATKITFKSWKNKKNDFALAILNKTITYPNTSPLNKIEKKQIGIIYILLANTYWNKKENSKAFECWKELVNKNYLPEEENWIKLVLADQYLSKGNKSEAIRLYEEVSRNDKDTSSKEKAINALNKLNEG